MLFFQRIRNDYHELLINFNLAKNKTISNYVSQIQSMKKTINIIFDSNFLFSNIALHNLLS